MKPQKKELLERVNHKWENSPYRNMAQLWGYHPEFFLSLFAA
jgi:hypothetical protein